MLNLSTIAESIFRSAGAVEATRRYSAASRSRLVGDWTTSNLSANQEIKDDLKSLRARSRQLARDNDYFIGWLRKMEIYVIGLFGLKLQVDAKKTTGDKKETLNKKVEDEWALWCRKENCDVTGQRSFRDIEALALRTLLVDGEFLIRKTIDADGPKLQMLDVDWLNEDYNDPKLPNGNRIVMSIELDKYDKPVAYHFTHPKWSAANYVGITPIVPPAQLHLRVPANEIIHRFIPERIGQVRGVPSAHGSMMTLNQLDGFDEAELIGARVGASNMAFVSPPAEADGGTTSEDPLDTEVSPGQILELPAGYTVHEFTPQKPLDTSWSKRMLRKAAGSLGIDYSDFANDLESVNFSSIRAGTINSRDGYRMMQQWIAMNLCQDVYAWWLMMSTGVVTAGQIQQVLYPKWRGRGFDWVDPVKDVQANTMACDRGFKTLSQVHYEAGEDFEDVILQLKYEQEFIEASGVKLQSPSEQAQMQLEQQQMQQDQADAAATATASTAGKK